MSVKKDPKRGTWFYVVDVAATDGKRRQMRRRGFTTKNNAEQAEALVVAPRRRARSCARPV